MIAIDLSERQKQILAYMDAGVEYSTEQVAEKRRNKKATYLNDIDR